MDPESGLYYNWHRFYDPETGRYISADPIGLRGGINVYSYVGGDPIGKVDRNGLKFPKPFNVLDFTVSLTVIGAGEATLECCDKNNVKHRATFHKICFGFALGANAGALGKAVGIRSCPGGYSGWFHEYGGALGLGWNAANGGGITQQGPVVGVGGGYMYCYYQLWNDQKMGCCDK